MNDLEDFVNHTLDNKPNDVHGRAGPAPQHGGDRVRRQTQAKRDGQLHGALYYAQARQTVTPDGVWENEETVRSRLISKEQFPQG